MFLLLGLLLALPTVMAYYPNIGYGGTYPWGSAAGSFVGQSARDMTAIYVGSGINLPSSVSLDYPIISGVSTVGQTPAQAEVTLTQALDSFQSSRGDALLATSPYFL